MHVVRTVLLLIVSAVLLAGTVADAQSPRQAKHPDMRTVGSAMTPLVQAASTGTAEEIALQYLREHATELGFVAGDLADIHVSSLVSEHSGVTHVYMRQRYAGIDVHGTHINFNVTAEGEVLGGFGNSFVTNLEASIASQTPAIGAIDAATNAVRHVGLVLQSPLAVTGGAGGASQATVLSDGGVADKAINAHLVYERVDSGEIVPAWLIEIPEHDGDHWWEISVDAQNGAVLEQVDNTITDVWHRDEDVAAADTEDDPPAEKPVRNYGDSDARIPIVGVPNSGTYLVYAWPDADPNYGPRKYAVDPADPVGSPFGWHDTDGAAGPESTQTVGNNVDAYLDRPDDDVSAPEERVDGGAGLFFEFPLDLTAPHNTVQSAAVANLFYWNNIIHDITYRYGFTESAGNFQVNHYGKFPVDPPTNPGSGDPVRAEAQDGSGMNNANFSTGNDGSRPRMQMFLWVPQGGYEVQVQGGSNFGAVRANFGAFLADIFVTQPTAQVVLASPVNACAPLVGFPAGAIAYVDTGTCNAVTKARNAQNAGAAGIVINLNTATPATITGIGLDITIPVLGLSSTNNAALRPQLPVSAKMAFLGTPAPLRDGDFDAGVIMHEYTHGISNRLTGGRLVTGCLGGNEQMGEGWSDWISMVLSHNPAHPVQRTRGLGPYIRFTGADGPGIRTTRYSTDMTINPTTYATIATGTLSIPHGIGYAWSTMLWEVYWNLIDKHGFNKNIYEPWYTGGNNLAMQLVMDGMKLQVCRPGFVNGRDAILQADNLLTGGANQCAIWKGFAKRGLGFSASQGSSNSTTDGTEAFDLPAACRAGIAVEPALLDVRLEQGKSVVAGLRVRNTAAADGDQLNWTAFEAAGSCATPVDLPWLSLDNDDGSAGAQFFSKPRATLNATGLAVGDYSGLICFAGNGGTAQIPVTLRVKAR
jgi:extracellular elastinolytic metalloproteinase